MKKTKTPHEEYIERLIAEEDRNDRKYFKERFERAFGSQNYEELSELVEEGLWFDYEIPYSYEPIIAELIKLHSQSH